MKAQLVAFAVVLIIGTMIWQTRGAVNCTSEGAGRHAITGTSCKMYTYCVYDSTTAAYLAYNYTCPSTSVFNANTNLCTASYNCTA